MIDTLWASHLRKFNEVASNLRQHSTLLRHGVTLTDINEARQHRIQSLALLDETHKDQQRQKFASLRDRFSVNLYDERLDWIRNRSVAGCEKWLLEDSIFCSWKDVPGNGNQNTAWLWLQGIPGAGKTYICSAAIDHLRQDGQNQVLFAFLSHAYNVGQRALNVLQSFLFQAAEDDLDLQSVLIDARERELRGNTGYVVDLLKSWLQTAGPTYVVVDGLDEMDPIERKFLLERLEELAKGSDALRFLVCSRLEADIRSELKERATVIQVNKRNSGSIQTYINSRFHDWVNRNRFDHNIRLELRQLLSPLSARSKGMFLFARIIIDGVEEISSLDEIRSELKAMPNDLDDAYQRIFQRINKLAPADREKRRKILGWIGCAPVPMTIYEMTQAISLHTSSEDSVPQDFLRLCGPLIEVVDVKLQFVHFTAQEYIFSKQIADFIDEKKATQDLVAMLLDYLDSDILELDADDNQISGDILCGKYRLLQFAHFYLPTLLQRLNSDGPMPDVVGKQLDLLARGRKNHEFTVVVDSREPPYANDIDKSLWPIGYECARRTFQFHLDEKRWSWNRGNSEAWVNLDPLVTSKVLVRIQDLYEKLIHDDDSGKSMEYHYGPRLFKCTYLFCSSSRQGFETRHDRDTHVNHHERPYKCSVPNCIYYTLGFNTPRRCEEHLAEFHASKLILDNISNLTTVDLIQPLLFALVIEGQSEDIERLLSSPGGKKLSPEILASARLTGAKRGSKAITNLLAPPDEKDVPWKIVEAAMKSQDAACVEYVVAGASTDDYSKLMKLALVVQSDDVYTIWEQHIINKVKNQELRVISEIFKQQVFRDIKGNALKETRLQHTLERLRKYLNRLILGDLLVRVAKTSCSFAIAKQLLIYGAPVDHPRWTYPPNRYSGSREGSGMTALLAAAKKTDKDSAELVRHLMLLGADTFDVNMEEQPCVKEMKALIGITWNDLLELVKQRLSH